MKTLVQSIIIAYAIYTVSALTGYFAGFWTIEGFTAQLIETGKDILTLYGAVMFALLVWSEK